MARVVDDNAKLLALDELRTNHIVKTGWECDKKIDRVPMGGHVGAYEAGLSASASLWIIKPTDSPWADMNLPGGEEGQSVLWLLFPTGL
ncbi:hypothetical protein NT6N_19110 [Oceaniferula spumae]|uniref:Uncharacterized protein n=1 Tax=Oceaniferula spumae TaxID=2979115 RepID=A0AAT9FLS2_9BACT